MLERSENFWETNYKQNIATMIGICYRYTHNRQIAEDLAHEAFLLAIDKSSSFENKGPFEAWLRRIVINVSLQYLREKKKQQNLAEGIAYAADLVENQDEKERGEENTFTEAELLAAIRLLPEHHQLVFNLYVIDHFTHAQIAAELGISEGTSKSHLARARKKIRELLNQKLKEKNKKKGAFLLFFLPYQLWDIDHFFTKGLNEIYLKMGMAAAAWMGIVSILYFNQPAKNQAIVQSDHSISNTITYVDSTNDDSNKFSSADSQTATFSKNDIIAVKSNETMEEMKSLKTLGTLLMLSSALALDTPNLLTNLELLPVSKKQEVVGQTPLDFTAPSESMSSTTRKKGEPLSGTFYASSITYTSTVGLNPFNVLVVKGNPVKIDLNFQKFNGKGSFVFLDHVDYLLVDGVPVKFKQTIKLRYKKYSLTELDEKQSAKKYGEHVKKAIEIALAE